MKNFTESPVFFNGSSNSNRIISDKKPMLFRYLNKNHDPFPCESFVYENKGKYSSELIQRESDRVRKRESEGEKQTQ